MIAATDPQEFIPSGRQHVLRHPGPVESNSTGKGAYPDDVLLNRFERVSLSELEENETWIMRRSPHKEEGYFWMQDSDDKEFKSFVQNDGDKVHSDISLNQSFNWKSEDESCLLNKVEGRRSCGDGDSKRSKLSKEKLPKNLLKSKLDLWFTEEELYVKGNVVVWSKGLMEQTGDNNKRTICSYCSQYPVKQALWCTFHCERPNFISSNCEVQNTEKRTGTPMPSICIIDTQTIKVFTSNHEDFVNSLPFNVSKVWNTKYGIFLVREDDEASPKLYSLTHPLEETYPVAIKHNGYSFFEESNLQVIYTSEDPSFAVVYNSQTCQHSVYLIRKLKLDEWVYDGGSYMPSNASVSSKLVSLWDTPKNFIPILPSPTNTKPMSVSSGGFQHSRPQSSMAAISRCQSPAISPLVSGHSGLSKHHLQRSLKHSVNNSTMPTQQTNMEYESFQMPNPDVCLEYVWSEAAANNCPASKVFLSEDLIDQWYLCFLLPEKSQLTLTQMDFSNPNWFNFGLSTSVSAKDAVPVTHLHMLAILDHTGNVLLYSGLNIIGKLHLGGVLAQHIPSPLVKRNLMPFNSPFPRRSSLLPTCKETPVLEHHFDEHILSPVLPQNTNTQFLTAETTQNKVVLCKLRDSIENRITLQYSDGTFYRVILPQLTRCQLIEDCINVLRQTLQLDAATSFVARWYSTRNSPGSVDFDTEKEWLMFKNLLLELLGYEHDSNENITDTHINTPAKRQRQTQTASDADWKHLTTSTFNKTLQKRVALVFNLAPNVTQLTSDVNGNTYTVNTNAMLFRSIRTIHYSLHLLYEELKMNRLRNKDLPLLAALLGQLANDLDLIEYAVHYWKDFPDVCQVKKTGVIEEKDLKNAVKWSVMSEKPFFIMRHLEAMVKGLKVQPYPYIPNVNNRCRDIIQIYGVLIEGTKNSNAEVALDTLIRTVSKRTAASNVSTPKSKAIRIEHSVTERVVLLMTELSVTTRYLDTLPAAVSLFLYEILWMCRENPPGDWPASTYFLLWRPDLAAQSQIIEKDKLEDETKRKYGIYNGTPLQEVLPLVKQVDCENDDGMEDVDNRLLKLRFPDELRVAEARRLLQSSKPANISIAQRPGISDHEYLEEQERHLFAVCTRTLALPVGRGMFTLRTAVPVITEPLLTPPLCLTGKSASLGTTIELTHIDMPSNINLWPLFHNGVANGLRIAPDAQNIDTNWITFNKPKGNHEAQMEHAGFLMALGLNGHLRNLAFLSTYKYLVQLQEMTSVGLLLGLSAAFRGTCHSGLTKTLSVHIEALLPPTSMELDVPQNLQVAALLGVGLVYEASGHRHMTEVLLTEIGRPPGPEMENSVDRESYSLAAGLALGLVTLKQGGRLSGLADLNVPDLLHYYMVGGNKRALQGSQKDKYKVASFQIKEGSCVNLDVTSPGATLALGLMYMETGNKAIADWMAPPETQYLLDFVRPDFLMLRVLARALIMWHDVRPTDEWVEKQFPESIRPYCMRPPSQLMDVDYEAMNQVYCNIVAGACFAIGLKYAGTADETAFRTLLHYCHMFTTLTTKSISELAGKPTIETCLNVTLISAAMVMAGTGNLDVMRLVRHLRRRVGVAGSAFVTYGSHLMTHMALGLLFLGGGRYTLSNSAGSVALLICAFYPKFPTHSNDNRYHLQAFRHLYVLAAEPRIIIPKDGGNMCYARLKITYLDGTDKYIRAPDIIPDLNVLVKVEVNDERYWPIVFKRGRNWEQLQKLLSTHGICEVKQRAGCLSYLEDKLGYHSQLARTLTQSEYIPWDPPSKAITSFTSESTLRFFCDNYLNAGGYLQNPTETKLVRMLTRFTYDCIIKDKLPVLPIYACLVKIVGDLKRDPNVVQLEQMRLAKVQALECSVVDGLLSCETVMGLVFEVREVLEGWERELRGELEKYLKGEVFEGSRKLATYVSFFRIEFGSGRDLEVGLRGDWEDVGGVLKVLEMGLSCKA